MPHLARAAVAAVLALLLWPVLAWAGRPLETEDTGTVAVGDVEVAVATELIKLTDQRSVVGIMTVTTGFLPGLEGRIEVTGFAADRDGERGTSGFGAAAIGFKYRILDETDHRPAVLTALTVFGRPKATERDLEGREPAADGVDLEARLVLSKAVGPTTVTWNGGYAFATDGTTVHTLVLGLSVNYRATKSLSLVAETFSEITLDHDGPSVMLRAGAIYAITDRIQLDGAVGAGLTRNSPDVTATVGVTFRF